MPLTIEPGSIAFLAEMATPAPWEEAAHVPFSARQDFQKAVTPEHYLKVLEALSLAQQCLGGSDDPKLLPRTSKAVDDAIAEATGRPA